MTIDKDDKELDGRSGERLIAHFFDRNFSEQFSFANPKTKTNAEVGDVLVWFNRVVLLIEVKTRCDGGKSVDQWAAAGISKGVEQIRNNISRLNDREAINLHNRHYHLPLQYEGLSSVIGMVVLVSEEKPTIRPSDVVSDIYQQDSPIHVFTWNDLLQMTAEIDSVPDLTYYLQDRLALVLTGFDIPLSREMHALACYKLHHNRFPTPLPDVASSDVLDDYRTSMRESIAERERHNRFAELYDHIVTLIPERRKLHHGLPTGLYFAWEMAATTRRQRAYYGEMLARTQRDFQDGRMADRRYALYNPATGNWLVFLFSKDGTQELCEKLIRAVDLKLIKEVAKSQFEYGVYGLGFQISQFPLLRFSLCVATFNGAAEVAGFTEEQLQEALTLWGSESGTRRRTIEEFPSA